MNSTRQFKKENLERLRRMQPAEMRAVLATMLMDCNVSTTTLSKSFANAMDNPLFLLEQFEQKNDASSSTDEAIKKKSTKTKKKKRNKLKRDAASKSRSKKQSKAVEDDTDDGINDKEPTKRRSKLKRREKASKKASKKRQRDVSSDDGQSDDDRLREKEEKRARRKERRDERRQQKTLKRLEKQRDGDDPDYAPSQTPMELSADSDNDGQSPAPDDNTERARSSDSESERRSVPAVVSDNDEDEEPQSAADAVKSSKKSRKSKKNRRKKSRKESNENESELEEPGSSARKMVKKLMKSGKEKPAKKAKAGRASRKGNNVSQELGESIQAVDVSNGEQNTQAQSPMSLEDSSRDSLGGKRARASKQKAKPSLVDRLSHAGVPEDDDAPATPGRPLPTQQPEAGTQRKRGRGDGEGLQENDLSASNKRRKTHDDHDANELDGQQVAAQPLASSPSAAVQAQSPNSVVAQVRPFPGTYTAITPRIQQEHEAPVPRIKQEFEDDTDIQMFNSPITPFKIGNAVVNTRGPLPIRGRVQRTPENSTPLLGGHKVGQHTYFVRENGGNASILATPTGSRTLSLGNIIAPQAQQSMPVSQTKAGPSQGPNSCKSSSHMLGPHISHSHSPKSHNSDTRGGQTPRAPGGATHPQSVRSDLPKARDSVKNESDFKSTPANGQNSPKSNAANKSRSLVPTASEWKQIRRWQKQAKAASPITPRSRQGGIIAATPSQYQISQWTPNGERRFKCNFCGRWFKYSQNPGTACQGMHPGKHLPCRADPSYGPVQSLTLHA